MGAHDEFSDRRPRQDGAETSVDPGAVHDMPDSVEGPDIETVPAGGAGADSGAASVVSVDPDDEGATPDVSAPNDTPGINAEAPEQ